MLVKSSTIQEVDFIPADGSGGTLVVVFNSGLAYEYVGVLYKTFKQMIKAESVGKFFDANVKKAGYQYRKISQEENSLPIFSVIGQAEKRLWQLASLLCEERKHEG